MKLSIALIALLSGAASALPLRLRSNENQYESSQVNKGADYLEGGERTLKKGKDEPAPPASMSVAMSVAMSAPALSLPGSMSMPPPAAGDNPPCSICGAGKMVGAGYQDTVFAVPGAATPPTCGQLEQAGQIGVIDPLSCGLLAFSAQEICGCVALVPVNPIEPVPENPIEPVPEPAGSFSIAVEEPAGSSSFSLLAPVEPGSTPLFAKASKTSTKSAKSKTLKDLSMPKAAKSVLDPKAEKVSKAKSAKAKSTKVGSVATIKSAKLFKESMSIAA